MADSTLCSNAEADELFSKLHRLVSARKKYPLMIMNIERKRQNEELKIQENIHAEPDTDDQKEIQVLIADVKNLAKNLENCQSSFLKTKELCERHKKNFNEIEKFLEFRKTFAV